jgi:hypothetical protein
MNIVINHEELVEGLAQHMLLRKLRTMRPTWSLTNEYLKKQEKRRKKCKDGVVDTTVVNDLLGKDLKIFKDIVVEKYKKSYRPLIAWLAKNYNNLALDRQLILNLFFDSQTPSFAKSLGKQFAENPTWKISGEPVTSQSPVLLRGNSQPNQNIIKHRLKKHLPFWFLDTGYTNFLTGKKTWHRLIKNHIHHGECYGNFPADRLSFFESFPLPWRSSGTEILIVENSQKHFEMFGTSLLRWRANIRQQLAKITDRPLIFRPKHEDRKTRPSLCQDLMQNDYYCVITDASSAAIESVWAGIPIITLNQHISVPVARTNLKNINDLYRGPIGDWLCRVSYSQFTSKEIFDGTALEIIEQYHV